MRLLAGMVISILFLSGISALDAQDRGKKDAWKLLQPANTPVKFEMPTEPEIRIRELPAVRDRPKIKIHVYNSVAKNGKSSVVFSYHEIQEELLTNADRQRTLAAAAIGAINHNRGTAIRNEPIRFQRSYFARELAYLTEFRGTIHKISTRLILIENRLYNLSVVFRQDDFDGKLVDRFFSSFEVISDDYDLPPRPRFRR